MPSDKMLTLNDGCDAYGLTPLNPSGDIGQFWPRVLSYLLDKNFEDPATRESYCKCIVVADPVMLQSWNAVGQDFGADLKESSLNATTADTADCLTIGCH
jgi:hypothetical protein